MPRLVPATEEQVRRITAESHALWGGGLSHEAYLAMWVELARTPWARRFYRHYAWVGDDGVLLSSVKIYRPVVRLFERTGRATAIGAVFTPRDRRRRGHAAAMLRAVVGEARDRGDLVALLFTDIGTTYYERLGFTPLPADAAEGVLDLGPGRAEQGIVLRAMVPSDSPSVIEAHESSSRARCLAVVRDLEHWSFVVARSRAFLERRDGADWTAICRTAVRGGAFAGYLVALSADGTWNLREAAAAGGDPQLLAAILRAGAAEARASGARRVSGWLPREFRELVPEWRLRFRAREHAIPMLLPLAGEAHLSRPMSASEAYLWPMDHF